MRSLHTGVNGQRSPGHGGEEMGINQGFKQDFQRAEGLDQKRWGKKVFQVG